MCTHPVTKTHSVIQILHTSIESSLTHAHRMHIYIYIYIHAHTHTTLIKKKTHLLLETKKGRKNKKGH